jgi:hypothetical protein
MDLVTNGVYASEKQQNIPTTEEEGQTTTNGVLYRSLDRLIL